MGKIISLIAALLLLVGCGPDVNNGYIMAKNYEEGYTVYVPVTTVCGNGCVSTTIVPQYFPEKWSVYVEDCDTEEVGECLVDWVEVDRYFWEDAEVGQYVDFREA